MAKLQRGRAREAQLAFEAISIEGGLLTPEWLAKISQLGAGGQGETDYRIPKGLNIRDEIGRFWRIAQAHWSDFVIGRAAKADPAQLAVRFVTALLRDGLGFVSLLEVGPQKIGDRMYPIGRAALSGQVPVAIAPAESGLDTLSPIFGDAGRRRSPFGLTQEFLNAQEGALWGLASDAVTLRILRDNASLTRPAWIEADLRRIFAEERYSDFAVLWLLAHESRFGAQNQPAAQCPLETWRAAGREQGTRARDQLRRGVEEALVALGQGFLAHPDNAQLRAQLQAGTMTAREYFSQLLRLVYRMIFLLTVEERSVLHPPATGAAERSLYADGYSLRRLSERSVKRSAHDRFSNLWEAVKIVVRGLESGEPRLGLPALRGIFAAHHCTALDAAHLQNHSLLLAVFKLAWLRESTGLTRVNWRDMGAEELGSVYESLMELVPRVSQDCRDFDFAVGSETKGNARKMTGSYYTPDSLVQVLLDGALDPVIGEKLATSVDRQVEALLGLSIVDPACGSGHFLLAAARRLAAHVARLQANGTPSAAEYRHALRQVVGGCIYGVDLNPMAVELCKVSLWMEAVEPGLPLTFLDSHIQCGNALLGATPELLAKGIPDAAWEPIEGDDKKIASMLRRRNKEEQNASQLTLGLRYQGDGEARQVGSEVARLDAEPDADARTLAAKEDHWQCILKSAPYQHQKFVADAWCAAFVWPKQLGALADAAPTNSLWRQLRDGQGQVPSLTTKTVKELAEQYRFFHWHLQFPQVSAKGGFDVVLGNPPWDSVRFNEEEFFAALRPEIARASTAAVRKKLVAQLETESPSLLAAYRAALREIEGINAFVRTGVRYPLCGVGRVNLFGLFAEAARALVGKRGRVGQILPSGIVTDDSTKMFFRSVVERRQLVSFFDFENQAGIFPAVHRSYKFGVLTLAGERALGTEAEFVFFATHVEHLKDPERRFCLSAEDIALLNPDTKTSPVFRSRHDAEITKAIYRRVPVIATSGWNFEQRRLINQSDDSGQFVPNPGPGLLPLYEGKYFHHYDHHWVTNDGDADRALTDAERRNPNFEIRPHYWFPAEDARSRFGATWKRPWVLAWRDIARATDERTFIAAVVPSLAVPNTARVIFVTEPQVPLLPSLVANLGSFAFDFVARQKIGGTHMSGFIVDQLPVLAPQTYERTAPWDSRMELHSWLLSRVLELTYTAWDLEPFARDVEYDGPPFRWDSERRFLLRCEIDAALFHLYGLSRDDTTWVMDSFPIVRRNDEKAHGDFRTKRVILEVYDAMADAARTEGSYRTRPNPPPADPRVAHQDTRPAQTAGRPVPRKRGAK